MTRMSRRAYLAAGLGSAATLLAGCLSGETDDWESDETLAVSTALQYQGPECDCCGVYAEYLDDHLDVTLSVTEVESLQPVKEEHGIHPDLWSCHTIELDEYVVEGHVPVEVISSLFADRPDLDGISLPGMPAGSPGMGGQKDGTWTVYGFDDGEFFEYATL